MKSLFSLCFGGVALAPVSAFAQALVITLSDPVTHAIPDGSSSGVVSILQVDAPGQLLASVEVDLDLSAITGDSAFLGDLYLYLSNGSESAILLNRPGRSGSFASGYDDDESLLITLSASGPDLHNYRLELNGSHTTSLAGPLTGVWSADGRAIDPALVLATTPRTAGLEVFQGASANGDWTLFAADLSTGAAHQINNWTLRLTTIPEPSTLAVLSFAGLAFIRRRARRAKSDRSHTTQHLREDDESTFNEILTASTIYKEK